MNYVAIHASAEEVRGFPSKAAAQSYVCCRVCNNCVEEFIFGERTDLIQSGDLMANLFPSEYAYPSSSIMDTSCGCLWLVRPELEFNEEELSRMRPAEALFSSLPLRTVRVTH